LTAFCVPSGNKFNTVNPLEHTDFRVPFKVGTIETVSVLLSILSIGYAIRFTFLDVLLCLTVAQFPADLAAERRAKNRRVEFVKN
jgi:hypothetical protein